MNGIIKQTTSRALATTSIRNPPIVVPFNEHYKYETHKKKVLRLYKKCYRTVIDWSWHTRSTEVFIWERNMLRARFEKHRNETDMVKCSALLKAAEEEWWVNRHPVPMIMPWSDGGVAFQRAVKNQHQSKVMTTWMPEDRARYPDMFEKFAEFQRMRYDTWDSEMARLDEHEEELANEGETITDVLPAAKEVDGLPPFWWRHATRGHERPELMVHDWMHGDMVSNP